MPSGDRCPLPSLIFSLASAVPGSWPSQCADTCSSLDIDRSFGVCSCSSPGSVQSWFRARVSPRLDQFLRHRSCTTASAIAVSHVDLRLCPNHVARPFHFACGGSLDGVTILALVVVSLARHFGHSLSACSVMLGWPHLIDKVDAKRRCTCLRQLPITLREESHCPVKGVSFGGASNPGPGRPASQTGEFIKRRDGGDPTILNDFARDLHPQVPDSSPV